MSRLQSYQCPLYKEECITSACALYESNLDNCVLKVIPYNLYRIDMILKQVIGIISQYQPDRSPLPSQQNQATQPQYPGMS